LLYNREETTQVESESSSLVLKIFIPLDTLW